MAGTDGIWKGRFLRLRPYQNPGSSRGIRSADAILPELQHPKPGKVLPLSVVAHLVFSAVEPNRYLVGRSESDSPDGVFTWALYPQDRLHTRLVSRIRLRYHWKDRRLALDLFTEFCDHIAVPAILRGVKARVEGSAPPLLSMQAVALAVWLLALAEESAALLCIFRWSDWRGAFLLALAAMATLLIALYAHAPVWVGAVLVWLRAQRCSGRRDGARIEPPSSDPPKTATTTYWCGPRAFPR